MLSEAYRNLRIAFKIGLTPLDFRIAVIEAKQMSPTKAMASDLLLSVAREHKNRGRFATVEELVWQQVDPYYQEHTLILRWDRQEDADHKSTESRSKGVKIETVDMGNNHLYQSIEYLFNEDWILFGTGDQERKDPNFIHKLPEMPLERRLKLAMAWAEPGPESKENKRIERNDPSVVKTYRRKIF
mgnify:CR=1 FL=1